MRTQRVSFFFKIHDRMILTKVWILLISINLSQAVPPHNTFAWAGDSTWNQYHVRAPTEDHLHIRSGYGSHRYPLRDAVEAIPEKVIVDSDISNDRFRQHYETGGRVPLRDAVEHREAPYSSGPDYESIWITPLKLPIVQAAQKSSTSKLICNVNSADIHKTEEFSSFFQIFPDFKCTHLIYHSAIIDPQELVMISPDPDYDEIKGGYKSATGLRLRDPSLQVLISLAPPEGGELFAEATRRNADKLIASIIHFIEERRFDGIVIDWGNFSKNSKQLKEFIKQIRDPLERTGRILALVARPTDIPDPDITSMVDLIILSAWKTRDNYEAERLASHPAPLRFVVHHTNKWIQHVGEAQASKMILDVPMFGYQYTLKFENFTAIGAPVLDDSETKVDNQHEREAIPYYKICEKLEGYLWSPGRDKEGPYIKQGDQWIGYEDPVSLTAKMAFVRSVKLGGISLTSLNHDDFQGICGDPWPMLNAAKRALGLYENVPLGKCSNDGTSKDPDNCAGFFSCVKGMLYHGDCSMYRVYDLKNGCVRSTTSICKSEHSDGSISHKDES